MRNAYKISVGKPGVQRPLEKLRRRWEKNTRMDPREIGCEGVDWMHLAHDRNGWWVVHTVMDLRVS
jgi:hypothetical protein